MLNSFVLNDKAIFLSFKLYIPDFFYTPAQVKQIKFG
jgi:hypothetical protein